MAFVAFISPQECVLARGSWGWIRPMSTSCSTAAVTASSFFCGKVLLVGEADPSLTGYF